jgi:hypothetical protein
MKVQFWKDTVKPSQEAWPRTLTKSNVLSRNNGCFILPAFSVSISLPVAYSFETLQFNFSSPTPFSFISIPSGVGKNFCPVVRYRVGEVATRFKLWSTTELLYVPLYAGEVIKSNFVIEIWTLPDAAVASNASSLVILSSHLYSPSSIYDVGNKIVANGTEIADLFRAVPETLPTNYGTDVPFLTN